MSPHQLRHLGLGLAPRHVGAERRRARHHCEGHQLHHAHAPGPVLSERHSHQLVRERPDAEGGDHQIPRQRRPLDVAGRLDAGPGVAHHVDGPCEDGCGVQVLLRVQNGGTKAGQGAVQPVALGSRQRIRQCLEDKLGFGEISFLDPSWQWILDLFPNVVTT